MKDKSIRIVFVPLFILVLALVAAIWADELGERDLDMSDPGGNVVITEPGLSSVGEFSIVAGSLSLEPNLRPPSLLARQDYQDMYDEAMHLLGDGIAFRYSIMPRAVYSYTDVISNYMDYNGGALFYAFCSDYDNVDEQGYCAEQDDIRNRLIRARELFAFLSLAEPADAVIDQGGVRSLGRQGVVSASREIANIHLIFGNEFLADALDYRFRPTATNADLIIAEEMEQLEYARQQFKLAVDVLAHALNADFGGPWGAYIGDYFGTDEFDLFGIASERLVIAMDEIADRYRLFGQDETAVALYAEGAAEQYVQALALADKARAQGVDFIEYGGFELVNNLNRLRAMAQAIRDGLDPFGYVSEYVPRRSFDPLMDLTRDELLRDATEDENEARLAQREFDANQDALQDELLFLRQNYDAQLQELCGTDFDECDGGLMEQNYYKMLAAHTQVRLTRQRVDQIPKRILIEQERAGQVIRLTLEFGQQIAALDYTLAIKNGYSESMSTSTSQTDAGTVSVGFPQLIGASYSHSKSTTTSMSRSWNPHAPEIAHLTSVKDLQQAAERAQIEGANSAAVIQTLLLEQANMLIELDGDVIEFNRLSAEHNHLVERYRNLLSLRERAQQNLVDSYMNNPAYRVLRETSTIEAARSHALAAQFALLTAKAAEYEFLTPVPFVHDIYKARTADDIDNFLNNLLVWRENMGNPGALNRYPRVISVAQDLLGLSDDNLDPTGQMTPQQRLQLRYELFQDFLQDHISSGAVEFRFTTSLQDDNIFSPNIWNNRIAGVGEPLPSSEGIAINLQTRQFGDAGTPEVILTHAGQASYRKVTRDIVEYTPGPTVLVGYPLPPGFNPGSTTAVLLCSVNGNDQGIANSALTNLSVAASGWKLRIDLSSPYNDDLDVDLLEDIEILMDTTGIALPGRVALAEEESLRLIEAFEKAKTHGVE